MPEHMNHISYHHKQKQAITYLSLPSLKSWSGWGSVGGRTTDFSALPAGKASSAVFKDAGCRISHASIPDGGGC
jgi:hypothetical protein